MVKKLILIGDFMLGGKVNECLEEKPAKYPWGDTLKIMNCANICMCNLECVISDKGFSCSIAPKVYHFRSAAKNMDVLSEGNINAVSLANNHVLDYGHEALLDMFLQLKEMRIFFAGAGKNRAETQKLKVITLEGIKLGILAFTDNQPNWEAGEDRPGIWYIPVDLDDERMHKMINLVKTIKGQIDILIISAHWGGNWGTSPPAKHRIVGKALIDAGADIIFGHSAHIFRGIEIYRNKAIIYSTGDFLNDYMIHPIARNDQSFIWEIEVVQTELQGINLYPITIRNFQAQLAKDLIAREIITKMSRLCTQLHTKTYYRPTQGCLSIIMPYSKLKL